MEAKGSRGYHAIRSFLSKPKDEQEKNVFLSHSAHNLSAFVLRRNEMFRTQSFELFRAFKSPKLVCGLSWTPMMCNVLLGLVRD